MFAALCAWPRLCDLIQGISQPYPPARTPQGYDEAFFTSRQRVMEAEVYRILNEALIQTLENLDLPDDPIIIDAGCGEGSYR